MRGNEEARQARLDAEEKERLDRVSHAWERAFARERAFAQQETAFANRDSYCLHDRSFHLFSMRLMMVTLVLTKT